MKKIQGETAKDSSLMRIARYVTERWPKRRDSIPADVKPYRSYKEVSLTVRNGLIFKSERLIIPISMRKKDVKQLLQAHMGRARATKFWHQINQKVERIVKTCNPCQCPIQSKFQIDRYGCQKKCPQKPKS